MLEAIRAKLIAEVEALNHELHVTLPEVLQKARELGDLKENGDYQAAKERQGFVALRLGQLRSRLSKLSQIDLSQIPVDRIGLGSRVTVKDLATKDEEVYELVIPDDMDFDKGHISVSSPLGQALLDHKAKDTVKVRLPMGERRLKVIDVVTFHAQVSE
ncbi:MAG: transcription elongation factor GreA [Gemmatimonadales bacterium]